MTKLSFKGLLTYYDFNRAKNVHNKWNKNVCIRCC